MPTVSFLISAQVVHLRKYTVLYYYLKVTVKELGNLLVFLEAFACRCTTEEWRRMLYYFIFCYGDRGHVHFYKKPKKSLRKTDSDVYYVFLT